MRTETPTVERSLGATFTQCVTGRLISGFIHAMERGRLPDPIVRAGIRRLCGERLRSFERLSAEASRALAVDYSTELKASPLAVHALDANRQHYELPPAFFARVLGKNMKYSSGFWPEGCGSLDEAEDRALEVTCERAGLRDGMRILELGCGWGSLTLFMARRYPGSTIVALSNSAPQRRYIEAEARKHGLGNLRVITCDITQVGDLRAEFGSFDRAVSVEMFEHLRNYELLFERISGWLKPDGKLFAHIFTHRQFAYLFETEGEDNWLGRFFFTGGQMPSHGLFLRFQRHLLVENEWEWSGIHYSRTAGAWLKNMDHHRAAVMDSLRETYGEREAPIWFHRWRVFFMSCEELFGFKGGGQWGVSHYLFGNRRGA